MVTIDTMENEEIDRLVSHNASFYWETRDTFPVLEVFRFDNGKNISTDVRSLRAIVNKDVCVDYELLGNEYYRIMLVTKQDETINTFITLSELLKGYGNNKWEENY